MAVFRIEKTKDYTVMSNHHLRNTSLSLKAKGLQSLMLSLPETWDYSLKGLAKICRNGVDGIGTALQELERHGYLTRRQIRDGQGKYLDLEYTIHEIPVEPVDNSDPEPAEPHTAYPEPENPDPANPDSGKPAQSSIKSNQCTKKINTELSNIHQSIRADAPDTNDAMDIYRQILKENIEYDTLCIDQQYHQDELEEILELMLETVCSTKKTIRIGGEDKPVELVKNRFMKLNQFHIEYVLDAFGKNTTKVRNIKSYLLTTLYNAPGTIDSYYKVQYKIGGTWLLYQPHADKSYTLTRTYHVSDKLSTIHTYWTQSGRRFLYDLLKWYGILPEAEKPGGALIGGADDSGT